MSLGRIVDGDFEDLAHAALHLGREQRRRFVETHPHARRGLTARADRAQQAVEQAMQGMVEAQLAKRDREERESDGTA